MLLERFPFSSMSSTELLQVTAFGQRCRRRRPLIITLARIHVMDQSHVIRPPLCPSGIQYSRGWNAKIQQFNRTNDERPAEQYDWVEMNHYFALGLIWLVLPSRWIWKLNFLALLLSWKGTRLKIYFPDKLFRWRWVSFTTNLCPEIREN